MTPVRICHITTLGQVRVEREDEVAGATPQTTTRFATQKSAWLLAYLALRPGRRVPRELLLDLFWPDLDPSAGRDNLSTTLSSLRRMLEPPGVPKGGVLPTTRADVGLSAEAVTTDVVEFERLLDAAERSADRGTQAEALSCAVALWGGDFLPGCYMDWAIREAERLTARHEEALRRWTDALEALGRWDDALKAARCWAGTDPYAEEPHARLAALLARVGQFDGIRQVLTSLERRLRDEFGVGASPETHRAFAAALAQNHSSDLSSTTILSPEVEKVRHRKAFAQAAHASDSPVPPSSHWGAEEDGGKAAKVEKGYPAGWGLPAPLDRFHGREAEMARLARLLVPGKDDLPDGGAARLVTLVGLGGVGKTRLATEFVRQAVERSGAWAGFVSLADLSDPSQILSAVAYALRLPLDGPDPLVDRIVAFFMEGDRPGASRALLVLDNLEQLLDDGPQAIETVRVLLERVPRLSVLCTSRRRLGVRGEVLVPVDPLAVPEEESVTGTQAAPDLGALFSCPSVRLYVDRAQAVRADFGLTPGNAPAVAALCRALEGSPLALELAASWVKSLPPRKMWERLSRDTGLGAGFLEARYEDLPERHRSLSAALDWSFRLLRPDVGTLFARLSVFRGGWTLEAAESVAAWGLSDALMLLARLEEASLAQVNDGDEDDEGGRGARWRFLETVREYAAGRLCEAGDGEETRRRHRRWVIGLAEDALSARQGPEAGAWLARLEAEHDNLRVALDRCSSDPEGGADGVQLAGALWWFWQSRGHLAEGRVRLAAALDRPFAGAGDDRGTPLRTRALRGAGLLAQDQGDLEAAQALHTEGLALSEAVGDIRGVAGALNNLGNIAYIRGDMAATRVLYERGLAGHRAAGNRAGEATVLGNLAGVLANMGEMDAAWKLYEQSLTLCRALGDQEGMAWSLSAMGALAYHTGRNSEASGRAGEALAVYRALGVRDANVANALMVLSMTALRRGRWEEAAVCLSDGLRLCRDLGTRRMGAGFLETSARLALLRGRAEAAARLLGAAEALRERIEAPHEATERIGYEADVEAARDALDEHRLSAAWAAGRALEWGPSLKAALTTLSETEVASQ